MQNKLQPSEACFALIRHFEGCSLTVYKDSAGLDTVGYGHKLLYNETFPDGITEDTAEHLLRCNVGAAAMAVNTFVHVQLNQNQFDACVSLFFNLGGDRLRTSTLLKLINSEDFSGVPAEWAKWCHAGSKVLPGLVARRTAEIALWQSGSGSVRICS
jgi:lysozyme